jgi:hypothetical protein
MLKNDSATSPATPPSIDPFTLAVQADSALKAEERDALLAARKSSRAADTAASTIAGAEKVTNTASAKAYAAYLEGAAEFWQSNYDKAAVTFASLTNAQPAWVRETATYMVGRALIDRAQDGAFDEYGSFSKDWSADARTVTAAEAALDKYLQQYPKGVYARSARGLKRRGYWLAQDTGKLEEEYGALMLLSPEDRNISDVELAQEIDNKIATPPDTPRDRASQRVEFLDADVARREGPVRAPCAGACGCLSRGACRRAQQRLCACVTCALSLSARGAPRQHRRRWPAAHAGEEHRCTTA